MQVPLLLLTAHQHTCNRITCSVTFCFNKAKEQNTAKAPEKWCIIITFGCEAMDELKHLHVLSHRVTTLK